MKNLPHTNLLSGLGPLECEASYIPHFLDVSLADSTFDRLKDNALWKQEPIILFGRKILQPRLTAWYGEKGYRYSNIQLTPQSWINALVPVKNLVEQHTGVQFNGALLNFYRNQKDSMGWHRDNERELGDRPLIASVSLGETRRFAMRLRSDPRVRVDLELEHGSLLVMRGATQDHWEHALPKTSQPKGGRINVTFRIIVSNGFAPVRAFL